MIEIDGAEGEGGGQILRSALSLSICTQQPFRIVNIRANRDKPGLRRAHLTAVQAAARISDAVVEGAALESRELTFRPGTLRAGDYAFDIGSAGSSTLVLQTVLPPLLTAAAVSRVRIVGGTHNPGAPPFDFLARAFLPLLARLGAQVALDLVRPGFYPRGGGEVHVRIEPATLGSLELMERGAARRCYAEAHVAAVPSHVATRELEIVGKMLGWPREQLHVRALSNDVGPGNALTVTLEHEHVTEVTTAFGQRGVRAEDVARAAAGEAATYLAATAPVGEHLADQLLLPMALGAGGRFRGVTSSSHLRSNAAVIERFTGREVGIESAVDGVVVTV
ncbi:MAG TPA: RNA 3'-terminal phosphate cyclase [Steroidobacteraceae bacterium]|nr:RNA 3'-terminal phosphate cyclase [Steroidobacteraceae bacterium]